MKKDSNFYERCRIYFGEHSEECADLIKAITDNWRSRCSKERMVDAIADVLNILEQLVYNFDEELIELGINYDNMNYPSGEMNVIVQWFGRSKENGDGDENDYAYPDIYMLRKNRVWSVVGKDINLSNEDDRKDFIKHLRDSAERLKVWSLLLSRQADELEEIGYTDTICYYPEERL